MESDRKLFKAIYIDDEIWALRGLLGIVDWTEFGFVNVGAFTDSREALEAARELKPDVIFTDIRMPDVDGMTLIEAVKETSPDTLFVIVSAYRDFEIAKKALKNDVSDYLIKPLDKAEVRTALTALYDKLNKKNASSFNITDYDLLDEASYDGSDVQRFIDKLPYSKDSRVIVSEADLSGRIPGLFAITLKGLPYAYFVYECDNPFSLEDSLGGIRLGVSMPFSSPEGFKNAAMQASKSYKGCFFYSANDQTARIQEYLYDNLSEKISIEDVCSRFFLSKSYIFELFRENAEVSAMGFLKKVRLCHAADLLKARHSSVSEVAEAVGFDDVGYFIKTFKTKFGCTPEQYASAR